MEHCLFCEYNDPHACDVCAIGYIFSPDERSCVLECIPNEATCRCSMLEVYQDGECRKCGVDNCLLCSVFDN